MSRGRVFGGPYVSIKTESGEIFTNGTVLWKTVQSDSDPGITYEVVAVDRRITCTCPGFTYRNTCKHADKFSEVLQ